MPRGSFRRVQKLCTRDPPRLRPTCLFICLILICILYNTPVITSVVLSWVLWVILANYQTWGSCGNPQICSQLVRSADGPGTPKPAACVWSEGSLTGTVPLAYQVYTNSRWSASELHCSITVVQVHHVLGLRNTGTQSALSRTFCLLYPSMLLPPMKIQLPLKSGCLRHNSGTYGSLGSRCNPYLQHCGTKAKHAPTFSSCVTSRKLLNLSEPQFPSL